MIKLDRLTDDQWQQVHAARADWLAHGLSTAPADRPTTETAITEMYRLIDRPEPQFVWVDSPAAATLAIWLFNGLTGKSTKDQLWSQLMDQLLVQLVNQLVNQLGVQLQGQLGDQLGDRLLVQLVDQLRVQLVNQIWVQLAGQVPESAWNPFYGGHEAHWIAPYHVPHMLGIVTYEPEALRRLNLWADLARSAGWWWPFENLCILSERPSVVHTEPWAGRPPGMVRLHCADGPSVQYRDGWTLHTWHGTRVPADLIDGDGWTPEQILKERNQEIRRCAIERLGWDAFIDQANLTRVGEPVPDPGNPGNTISLYDLPETLFEQPVRVLLCTNGTEERSGERRRFGLTVPAEIDDPIEAAAWTYDWPVAAYRQLEVRR